MNMYYCCIDFSLPVGTKSSYRKKRRIKIFLMDICFCIDIFALFIEKIIFKYHLSSEGIGAILPDWVSP